MDNALGPMPRRNPWRGAVYPSFANSVLSLRRDLYEPIPQSGIFHTRRILPMSLTCGARWCDPCPNDWRFGSECADSKVIIDRAVALQEKIDMEVQGALDVYDLTFPEDYLSQLDT